MPLLVVTRVEDGHEDPIVIRFTLLSGFRDRVARAFYSHILYSANVHFS